MVRHYIDFSLFNVSGRLDHHFDGQRGTAVVTVQDSFRSRLHGDSSVRRWSTGYRFEQSFSSLVVRRQLVCRRRSVCGRVLSRRSG